MIGAALILLGIGATLSGMWEHRHTLMALEDKDYRYADRPPIARFMGVALVLVGLTALTVVFLSETARRRSPRARSTVAC